MLVWVPLQDASCPHQLPRAHHHCERTCASLALHMLLPPRLHPPLQTKGLDVDSLFISHVQVNKAMAQRRRTYRAHGRINPYMSSPCHVEMVLCEKESGVQAEKVRGGWCLVRRRLVRPIRVCLELQHDVCALPACCEPQCVRSALSRHVFRGCSSRRWTYQCMLGPSRPRRRPRALTGLPAFDWCPLH